MWAYIVRRCLMGLVLVLAVTLVTFVLFFASPIDPARFACGKNCSEDQRKVTARALGYDKPVYEQWASFMKGVVAGREFPADEDLRAANPKLVTDCAAPCLGYSQINAKTVNELISEAAPVTLSLAIVALVMWLIGGILFGILAAITKGSFLDRGIVGLTLIAYAFPSFFIGVFILKYVAIKWEIIDYPAYISIAEGGLWTLVRQLAGPCLHPCAVVHGQLCADDSRLRPRVDERGLHPDRQGQRSSTAEGAVQAWAAVGVDAAGDDGRTRLRDVARRGNHHRVGLHL